MPCALLPDVRRRKEPGRWERHLRRVDAKGREEMVVVFELGKEKSVKIRPVPVEAGTWNSVLQREDFNAAGCVSCPEGFFRVDV